MDVQTTLLRIHEILENHPGEDAAWIASVIDLYAKWAGAKYFPY